MPAYAIASSGEAGKKTGHHLGQSPNHACPTDAAKTAPGICGCGKPDIDTDHDGICDSGDRDHDGVPDPQDNCPDVSNANQRDTDHDGRGDACDDDDDGDGVLDGADSCPLLSAGRDADHNGCPDKAADLCTLVRSLGLPGVVTTALCATSNAAAAIAPVSRPAAAALLDLFNWQVRVAFARQIPAAKAALLTAFATNAKANL